MKIKHPIVLMIVLFAAQIPVHAQIVSPESKILIAYFSHSGNTRIFAEQIQQITGGVLFEIQPAEPYPTNYRECVEQARKEVKSNYLPPLQSEVANITAYDVIFVGSPNWVSTIAPPVASFLTKTDLSGKTVVPFMTYGGGKMGHSVKDMQKLCPQSTLLPELPIQGSGAGQAHDEIQKWLNEIGITQ